ncbi:MAG: DUF971 domain-containing protein [Pseudomonadota bacterium]
MSSDAAWPTELRFRRSARELVVTFDDGLAGAIPYKFLREESPSAENKGHGNRRPLPRFPIPDTIDVLSAEAVGRYAVRIEFSDGHKTGLYTWPLLRELSGVDSSA